METNFINTWHMNAVYSELVTAIKAQYDNGNITENEVKKVIDLVKNTAKLKTALRFL